MGVSKGSGLEVNHAIFEPLNSEPVKLTFCK